MTLQRKNRVLRIAAAAVTLSLLSGVQGQYRINTGNTNDANNRIGAGGLNSGVGNRGRFVGVSSEDLVYGNVTGGKEFRGALQTTDSRAFRGTTAGGNIDRFVRNSASGYAPSNAQNIKTFYGESRGVNPGPGFVSTPGNVGYVLAPTPVRAEGDLRLGQIMDAPVVAPVRPGQLLLPGPVDSSNASTILTASPLYGIRAWNTGLESDQNFLDRYTDVYRTPQRSLLDEASVQRMRDQLNLAAPLESDPAAPQDGAGGKPLPVPLENPKNDPLSSPSLGATDPLTGTLSTSQTNRQRLLMQAGEQTPELGALQKRFMEVYGETPAQSDAEAARDFNARVRAMEAAKKKAGATPTGAGITQPPAQGSTAVPTPEKSTDPKETVPTDISTTPQPPSARPKPIVVKNLSSGVKVKEFADVLDGAEKLMKEGKWISAIEQYDQARVVAPNNPLVLIGRANANLGASYYAKAESDLRAAFTLEPALMQGQYDLRGMMGDERIEFVVNDLKAIAKKNPTMSRAYFLLAYVHYNIGSERMAAGYLDLAEKHAGSGDPFYTLVRRNWVFPEEALNK